MICFTSYLVSFCSCVFFFSSFSIAITSLGEERANLSAFRRFVRFVLVWICRFPLPLGVWEGLRVVIVALPGLFSYLFFYYFCHCMSLHVCPGESLFWIFWPIFGKNSPFGFLLVVFWLWYRCFKCIFLCLLCLGRKVLGNYSGSWSLPSFLLSYDAWEGALKRYPQSIHFHKI